MPTSTANSKGNKKLGYIDRVLRDYSGLAIAMVLIFAVVFIYGMVTAPNFLTLFNLKTNTYEFNKKAFNVSICNGQFFGGGWNISPKSSLQDGLLNIQIFKVTKIKAMKLFFLAKKGLHLTDPDVILKKSDKISLKTQQPIEIDGDFFDYGPAEISVKKHSIQLKI